jgi:hypothetical protein
MWRSFWDWGTIRWNGSSVMGNDLRVRCSVIAAGLEIVGRELVNFAFHRLNTLFTAPESWNLKP